MLEFANTCASCVRSPWTGDVYVKTTTMTIHNSLQQTGMDMLSVSIILGI